MTTTTTHDEAAEPAPAADAAPERYEAPELVEIAPAARLLQGIVYTKAYYDCSQGTTDYPPSSC